MARGNSRNGAAATPDDVSGATSNDEILRMATDIVSAYVSFNPLPSKQIPDVINTVYRSLSDLNGSGEGAATDRKPAVPIRRSVTPDYLVCLEDGKKLKMLKRHLRTTYNMSPEQYRARWNLPADYPMVAPNYAKRRSQFAKKIGLGKSPSSGRQKTRKRKQK